MNITIPTPGYRGGLRADSVEIGDTLKCGPPGSAVYIIISLHALLDYRHFGESGGFPRCLVSLEKQLEDYRTVLKYVRGLYEEFNTSKIVVMGSALSGLYISSLAIEDSGIAGAMAHCPMLDGMAL